MDRLEKLLRWSGNDADDFVRQRKNRTVFQNVIDEIERTKRIDFDLNDMSICNMLPVGMTIHQKVSGHFVYVNPQFAAALGYSVADLEWEKTWCSVSDMLDHWDGLDAETFRNFGQLPKLRYQWTHVSGRSVEGDVIPRVVQVLTGSQSMDLVVCTSIFDGPRREQGQRKGHNDFQI
jgi:PAS domain-containing protein